MPKSQRERAPKDLGPLTPMSFRDYVRFSSVETVLMHFHKLDTDGSGELTIKEFRPAIKKMGFISATKDECDMVFRWLDNDGSGKIPYKELDRKLRENPVDVESLRPEPEAEAEAPVPELPPTAPPPVPAIAVSSPGDASPTFPAVSTTKQRAPKTCSCTSMVGRHALVSPAALFLRLGPELDSERRGVLPKGARVMVLEEQRPEPSLVRVRVAMETNEALALGWVTSCREGHNFLKQVSASLTPRGWFTSAMTDQDGFGKLAYSMGEVRDRYNSIAGTISLLQQQASVYQQRLTDGTTLALDRDPMAQWSFQAHQGGNRS